MATTTPTSSCRCGCSGTDAGLEGPPHERSVPRRHERQRHRTNGNTERRTHARATALQDRYLVSQIEPQHTNPTVDVDAPTGATNGADDYGADKIKVLEGLEAVRKRP